MFFFSRKAWSMDYKWKFFKSARCVQVKLDSGADVAAVGELDEKLWTVLSASTDALRFDADTLRLLDSDGDGRIRVPEVRVAVAWLKKRFRNLDFLLARKDEISLADLDDSTDEGKALLASFKNILARAGRADGTSIALADVTDTTKIFNGQALNGDGVVTVNSTSNAAVSAAIAAIASTEGAVPDRSGMDGVDQTKVDAFFADAAAYLAWRDGEKAVSSLGDGTAAAYAAFAAVEAKIDEYFTPPEDLPLVAADPTPVLPLVSGVNPLWQARFRAFASEAAAPALGVDEVEAVTRDEWAVVKAKLAPYGAWLAAKAGEAVAGVGAEKLVELTKDGRMQAEISAIIGKDLDLADEYARLVDCERALRYAAHLMDWLENYVNQACLYDASRDSVFRTGTLVIDGRACSLCFHVANEAAHAALAERSKCCLLYVKLSRKACGEAREVCAVVTAGSTASLYVGRNGIFYDCAGNDWDAVVSKVVEAQVSLREAFWAPWAKIAGTVSEQCKKLLASKQNAAVTKVGDAASAVVAPPAAAPAPAPNGAALASSVAAIGIGVGFVGAACGGLLSILTSTPAWQTLLGVLAIILLVSLPSVILAWFKLRARDLGAILNAGGWAVNRPLTFSLGLARTFTRPAAMPLGAAVARDPYASHGWLKCVLAALLVVAAAAGVCWKAGLWPFPCRAECGAAAVDAKTSATTQQEGGR
jgi:hypothetical protein